MANAQRGEVAFTANGEEFRLRFGTNALCEIEAACGEGINSVLKKLQGNNPSLLLMRMIFAAGIGKSPETAGEIIDAITMERAGELIGKAMTLAFPAPEKNAGNGKAPAAG